MTALAERQRIVERRWQRTVLMTTALVERQPEDSSVAIGERA